MFVMALQSGSNGNCIYVESAGTRLLLDAGISGAQAAARLAQAGRDIRSVHGVLISHDHVDHARCAGVYQRKFGLPLYATQRTLDAAARRHAIGPLSDVRCFQPGQTLRLGDITVQTVPTPHDAVEGVAFVLDDGRRRLGVLTDLGHVFDGLEGVLASLDAVLLESNYDPLMLANGPYPWRLQERIRGPAGHLSNLEAAELVRQAARAGRLQWACLGHLSEENNTPDLALGTHRRAVGPGFALRLAGRYEPTGLMEV
jgi:phosphoribosyl 1,2-cyclic phosphodiesterase